MKEHMVRLSFDIPEEMHFLLKTECAQARLSIKDFVSAMILRGLKKLKEDNFKKQLKESIKQSREGKTTSLTKDDLDNWSKMIDNV